MHSRKCWPNFRAIGTTTQLIPGVGFEEGWPGVRTPVGIQHLKEKPEDGKTSIKNTQT